MCIYSSHRDTIATVGGHIIGEEVDKGEVTVQGYFDEHGLPSKTLDLCSSLSPVNLSCPFYPGTVYNHMIVC